MSRSSILGVCAILWALAFGACSAETPAATALVLSIKSDLSDIRGVEVAVFDANADPAQDPPVQSRQLSLEAADLPLSVVIERGAADHVIVAVRALDDDDERLAEARVRAYFANGKSLRLPIFLSTQCRDQFCDDKERETCYAAASGKVDVGECGPIPVERASELDTIMKAGDEHIWSTPETMDAGAERHDAGDANTEPVRTDGSRQDDASGSPDARQDPPDAGPGPQPDASTPDAGCKLPALATARCGLFPQCGCPANNTCRVSGTTGSSCQANGSKGSQTACMFESDCGAGLTCVGSRCTPFCEQDSDCGVGGRCIDVNDGEEPIPGARACLVACDRASGAPCGAGTVCATIAGQNFCITPRQDCSGLHGNGSCDEPEGSRLCVEASDPADCAQCKVAAPATGSCDPVKQCGCSAGQTCRHAATEASVTTSCRPAGTVTHGGRCTTSDACASGHTCIDGLCRRYCTTNADCTGSGGGYCSSVMAGAQAVPGLGTCPLSCDVSVSSSCPSGYVCGRLVHPFCLTPFTTCPVSFLKDGYCDEPEGTRLCLEGADAVDCTP